MEAKAVMADDHDVCISYKWIQLLDSETFSLINAKNLSSLLYISILHWQLLSY